MLLYIRRAALISIAAMAAAATAQAGPRLYQGTLSIKVFGNDVIEPYTPMGKAETRPSYLDNTSTAIPLGAFCNYNYRTMYVSMGLLQVAIGIGLANAWVVILVVPVLVAVYIVAVRPEEVYLTEKFGDAYLRYKSSVRRWV